MIAHLEPGVVSTHRSASQRSDKENIIRLVQTISASRLNCFLQCRLKFYFRYVLGIQKPKTPALHVGNTVHAALKQWHKARWLGEPLSLKQLHESYLHAWDYPDTEDKLKPVQWDNEEAREAAKLTGWRLCEVYLRECRMSLTDKPEAVEVSIEADLTSEGLPRLIGILDLVQQRKITDYKTSSTTPNPEKVAHTHEIQTSIYSILYRFNTGEKELGIELHHLVKLKNPKLCITELPPMSQVQQSRLYRLLEAYMEGVSRERFIPSPGMQCASCEYFNECRQWR